MAEQDQGEKTEEATQQRRDDFRKRGQVAQTRELASVLVIFTAIGAIFFLGRYFFVQLHEVFTMSFTDHLVASARGGDWINAAVFAAKKTFMIVSPLMLILLIMSLASSVLQVGFLTNEDAMKLKFDRLDPMQGFKRIVSIRSFVEGIKAVFKVSFVVTIAYFVIESEVIVLPQLVHYTVGQIFSYLGDVTVKLLGGVGFFMAVLAGIDYLFQRWDLEQKMKMTKQEVKEELKSREGDPLIKARIRRVQRELAMRRMMEDIPKSDVIITNPTHIAIAIKYSKEMIAPMVLAKGAGIVAENIKKLAKKNGIPIIENKPLARTIFKTIKIGQAIPRELYTAVAEVLSYVYKLRRKKKA